MKPVRRMIAFLRFLAATEDLDADVRPSAGSNASPRRGFVRWLLSAEELPAEPPAASPRRTGVSLGWLLAAERLETSADAAGDTDRVKER